MEKLDLAVAAAGAVVLAVAIVGAAMTGGPGAEYDVAFAESAKSGAPLALDLASGRAGATFELSDLNVTQVTVKVFVNATAAPGGYAARVTLTGPGNATVEKDATTGVAPGAQASLAIDVSIDLPVQPHAGRVRAASQDEAARGAIVDNATAGMGSWTIDVSFAPLGPVPAQGVTGAALPSWTTLAAHAAPAAPSSR